MKSPQKQYADTFWQKTIFKTTLRAVWLYHPSQVVQYSSVIQTHDQELGKTPTFGLQNLQKLVKIRQKVVTLVL